MAGPDDIAKSGADNGALDGDDLKSLLDSLAQELAGAHTRHTETLHDMQDRAAAMSARASTAKPDLPHQYGAAIDRIEAAMSTFSERLTDADPGRYRNNRPADDADGALPDTVRSEVRRAIMSAQREPENTPPSVLDFAGPEFAAPMPAPRVYRSAFGESGEEVQRPFAAAPANTAAPAAAVIEPAWLEARFANIAERVEQSLAAHSPSNALLGIGARFDQLEQRFDRALEEISSRPSAEPEALKTVERQITELFGQLDRATGQLGRLDTIESRLTDLRQSFTDRLSEEQMTRLIGALAPSEEKLTAIATSAAERVAATIRSEAPAVPAAPPLTSDPRLVELTAMLDAFIGEQRQGDVMTSEALDTMQQAMQHLIDRVEAIETAQIANHEALMLASVAPHPEPHVFAVRTPEPVSVAHPVASEVELSQTAVTPEPELPMPPASHAVPELEVGPVAKPATGSDLDRQALIAMARRAAEKVSSETPPASRAPKSRAFPRSAFLFVAGIAVFAVAGFWLVAGSNLRGLAQAFGVSVMRGSDASMVGGAPAQAGQSVEKRQGSLSDPARGDRTDLPASSSDAPQAAASEQPQPASLTTHPEPLPRPAVAPTPSTADPIAARPPASEAAPGAPQVPAEARSVEMPPALIGPLSLRHAAASGDAQAQFEVAARFAEGKGIPQDFTQAATWYQRAAAQGLASAQYRLGTLYERGLGVTADPARARVWYSRAAEQGNLRAMHNLAVLSAGRPGTKPDYPSAVQWFTEAANRGLADSQYNLGVLYESGLGVPANNLEAYKWYALAARSGDKDGTRRREAVRAKLSSASVKAADALVIQWRAKTVEPTSNEGQSSGPTWQSVRP